MAIQPGQTVCKEYEPTNTTQTQTQTLPANKDIGALWYAWRLPELNRHRATLDNCEDPIVSEAYAAIQEGDTALARHARQGGAVADLLNFVDAYQPPAGLLQELEKSKRTPKSLPDGFWPLPDQQPVMVMDFSKFSGHYPQQDAPKTCKTNWVAAGEGDTVKSLAPITFSLWRGFTMKSGAFMMPCAHCRHERVMGFCKHIERASELYRHENSMRYQDTTPDNAKKILDCLRQRRARGESENYTTFPLENGRVIVMHDAQDIAGQTLPTERGELYELVRKWALNTPKGKRAGHGLGTWGKALQIDSKATQGKNGPHEDKSGQDAPAAARWRIIGKGYGNVAMLLSGYLDTKYKAKGMKVSIKVDDFVKFLDEAGIDFAIDGNVTLNRLKPKDISAKCDNQEGDSTKLPDSNTAISPAPLYQGVINGL